MSNFNASPELSPKAKRLLTEIAKAGNSEAFAVADCLNDIASNGDEQATDKYLIICAGEIKGWADAFIHRMETEK